MKWGWVYLIALAPSLTEWLEVGHFPDSPRAAITELIMTTTLLIFAALIIRQAARLEQVSRTDTLTGLYNSRKLQEDLPREIDRARRFGYSLSLAYADLDNFKQINDRDGHAGGDNTLQRFGELLLETARRTDRCYRIGGDEFVVLMPSTAAEGAHDLLDRIRTKTREEPLALESRGAGISVGVVELRDGESPKDLLRRADHLMYRSKNGGKNRVTSA